MLIGPLDVSTIDEWALASGTLISWHPSPSSRAKALEAAGNKIIHLEIGEPDFPTPPHIVAAAVEALQSGQTHYVPAPGIPLLRESVAAFLERTGRMKVSPDRVIVTP